MENPLLLSSHQPETPTEIDEESDSETPQKEETCVSMPPEVTTNPSPQKREKSVMYSWSMLFWFLLYFAIYAIPSIILAILSSIIYIAALPVLILSFLVTRALQILWHGDNYDNAVRLKLFIRSLMFTGTSCLAAALAIFYGIAKDKPSFKQAVILQTPLRNWINLLFVIYGIYMLHCLLSVLIFRCVPKIPLDHSESGLNVPENVLEMIDCYILWLVLFQILKHVPSFKDHKILGLYTKNWIEASILVLLAYNVIVLSTRLIVRALRSFCANHDRGTDETSLGSIFMKKIMHVRYVMYFAIGIKHSIDFVLSSLLFLLTWVVFFGSHLEGTPRAKRVLQVGTITCVTLLVCAVLWFIKTCLLLLWEVRVVYNRLEHKIVEGANQLYFLGILGRHSHDIFNLRYDSTTDPQNEGSMRVCFNHITIGVIDLASQYRDKRNDMDDESIDDGPENEGGKKKKLSAKKKNEVHGDLLIEDDQNRSVYGMQQLAHYFLQAGKTLTNEKYTCDILDKLKILSKDLGDGDRVINQSKLKQLIQGPLPKEQKDETESGNGNTDGKTEGKKDDGDKTDWNYFKAQMSEYVDFSKQHIPLTQIEKWMVRAASTIHLIIYFVFSHYSLHSNLTVMLD